MAEKYSVGWMYHFCLSIHRLMDMWVVSTFLAIMNNAMTIHAQILAETYVFDLPRSNIAGLQASCLTF